MGSTMPSAEISCLLSHELTKGPSTYFVIFDEGHPKPTLRIGNRLGSFFVLYLASADAATDYYPPYALKNHR